MLLLVIATFIFNATCFNGIIGLRDDDKVPAEVVNKASKPGASVVVSNNELSQQPNNETAMETASAETSDSPRHGEETEATAVAAATTTTGGRKTDADVNALSIIQTKIELYTTIDQSLFKKLLDIAQESNQEQPTIVSSSHRKATLVIMSYSPERKEQVDMIVWCYSHMVGVFEKIIFVWNNLEESPPYIVHNKYVNDNIRSSDNHVEIEFWAAKENLMTNRYESAKQVAEPDSPVMMLDDDIFMSPSLVSIMLEKWRECNEDCIIGLDPRSVNLSTKLYDYSTHGKPGTLAIGKTMLIHRRLLEMYMSDQEIISKASVVGNACEDISLSLFVTNYTGLYPSFLEGDIHGAPEVGRAWRYFSSSSSSKKGVELLSGTRHDLPEPGGLSKSESPVNWTGKRSSCVSWCLDYFGKPLYSALDGTRIPKLRL